MPYTVDQLIAIARRYWRDDKRYDNADEFSPEHLRLQARWSEEIARIDWWYAFADRLRRCLPGFSIGNHTATGDASWKFLVYDKAGDDSSTFRFVVVGCVSLLAPVAALYAVQYDFGERGELGRERLNPRLVFTPLPPEMEEVGGILAREIEAYFGAELLPRELLQAPVPLIANFKEPPDTTLMHVLFAHEPTALP
jgi:hypothetical protein